VKERILEFTGNPSHLRCCTSIHGNHCCNCCPHIDHCLPQSRSHVGPDLGDSCRHYHYKNPQTH
jgi:hypothetical protein